MLNFPMTVSVFPYVPEFLPLGMLSVPLTVLFSFLFQSSTNELSRQNAVVRQLKQENEAANEQIRLLQDKYVLLKYLFLNSSFIRYFCSHELN